MDKKSKTKWKATKYPGVRYREHPTRKHGVRRDRYYAIYYRDQGKRREEGLGWESEGWTLQKSVEILTQIKRNIRTGSGPRSLAEMREIEDARRAKIEEDRKRRAIEEITFREVFFNYYLPQAKMDKKSWNRDEGQAKKWILPVIGHKPIANVSPFDVEKIKKKMFDAGRSDRTVEYALAILRHVFNFARKHNLFVGDNPVSRVKIPRPDNRRVRFLSKDEAMMLLNELKGRSPQLYRVAALSLFCGLRFGEIAALQWSDVDVEEGRMFIRDPKSGTSRIAYMPEFVRSIFREMPPGPRIGLVFPNTRGKQMTQVSDLFAKVVDELGLNSGVDDPRQKVVFHTLRHTFASWLAIEGVPMVTLKELLGHKTLAMTERYSHLSPHSLKKAVATLDKGFEASEGVTRDEEGKKLA